MIQCSAKGVVQRYRTSGKGETLHSTLVYVKLIILYCSVTKDAPLDRFYLPNTIHGNSFVICKPNLGKEPWSIISPSVLIFVIYEIFFTTPFIRCVDYILDNFVHC